MTNDERTLTLAALLHGLTDYLRGGGVGSADKPDNATADSAANFIGTAHDDFARCVDADLLQLLAQGIVANNLKLEAAESGISNDRRAEIMLSLLGRAKSLASSEPITQKARQERQLTSPGILKSVFDQIELSSPRAPTQRYFRQQALTGTDTEPPIFAAGDDASAQYNGAAYARVLSERLARILGRLNWDDFECVYTHLLNFLQTYTWCIPSTGQSGQSDVSLYDRSRTTSAVAACLYQHHSAHDTLTVEAIEAEGQTRCVLMTGGLSGIQNYIFDISTTGAGGVAKRLRARSFYVQLLSDAASLRVLRTFGLPLSNVLMASGGRFYVLLPDLPSTVRALRDLQEDFDTWVLKEFHGELSVNLAWTDLPDGDFAAGRYGAALARLHTALEKRKARRLAGTLQDATGWKQEFAREIFVGESVCLACRRFPAAHHSQDRDSAAGPDICDQCDRQSKLGRHLTSARYVSFFEGSVGDVSCLGVSASLGNKPHAGAFFAVRLNDPDLSAAYHLPAVFRYIANHIPRSRDGDPIPFDDIAGSGGLLGVLKADVDNLGLIVQEGFRRDSPTIGLDTLPRLAALSRQLDWFFSGWLEWLLANKYADCYTVYSGGDDLLIVGTRARTLDLAQEIRQGFSRYTQHPEVTLSAGLAVVKHRLPLAHTVHQANTALEGAKEAGRNRLCLLGDTLLWDDVAPILSEITELVKCEARSTFIYHLLHYAGLWQTYRREHKLQGLRYHSLLAYDIGRNVNQKQQPALHAWSRRLLQFPPQGEIERIWNHLKLIAQWVLLERRV
jgi:CRISPR-associated protein Csm1